MRDARARYPPALITSAQDLARLDSTSATHSLALCTPGLCPSGRHAVGSAAMVSGTSA